MKLFFIIKAIFVCSFIILFSNKPYSQTEYEIWQKIDVSYSDIFYKKTLLDSTKNAELNSIMIIYKKLLSNYDGDNCPFATECSLFFSKISRQTNFFYGFLSTVDRMLRELNFFERKNKYSLTIDGKTIIDDPVFLYLNKYEN